MIIKSIRREYELKQKTYLSVFSDQEIAEARKVPVMMKIIIGLFLVIIAGIFIPFQTVSELSKNVGALTAVQVERQNSYLRSRKQAPSG